MFGAGIERLGRRMVLSGWREGDRRVVALERRASDVLVFYGTAGMRTGEAFGSEWRVSCARLGEEHVASLARALQNGADSCLVDALGAYFSQEGVEFSDLLDLMDSRGIPYGYACADERGVVSREEAAAIAS